MYEKIEIRKSDVSGKGVFAKVDIPKGYEMVCDVLLVQNDELMKYQYPWSRKGGVKISSLCMGFGSYFNHSITLNVKVLKIDKNNLTKTFITIDSIKAGQEMFISYRSTKENNERLWKELQKQTIL